jgi:hypothetical protein
MSVSLQVYSLSGATFAICFVTHIAKTEYLGGMPMVKGATTGAGRSTVQHDTDVVQEIRREASVFVGL